MHIVSGSALTTELLDSPIVITQPGTVIEDKIFITTSDDICGIIIAPGATNVRISNCRFVGFSGSTLTVPKAAILVNGQSNGAPTGKRNTMRATIEGCSFSQWSTGVHANDVDGCIVRNSTFDNIVGTEASYGYGVTVSGNNLSILGNSFDTIGRHAIYLSFASNAMVYHNRITGCQSAGITTNSTDPTMDTIAIGVNILRRCCNTSTYTDDAAIGCYGGGRRLNIHDNFILDSGRHSIYCRQFSSLQVKNNMAHRWFFDRSPVPAGAHGLIFDRCSGQVAGNDIHGADDTQNVQIECISSDLTVSDNTFRGTTRAQLRNNLTSPVSKTTVKDNYGLSTIENREHSTIK